MAQNEVVVRGELRLVAPTPLRFQLLSMLFQTVQRGEMSKAAADRHLDHVRGLRIRLLGNRVLQAVAWKVAEPSTRDARHARCRVRAPTQLQTDAHHLNPQWAAAAKELVTLGRIDVLT